MIIDITRDIYITDTESARDFLRASGIDDYQQEDFLLMLKYGDAADELEELREQREYDERYQDGLYTALCGAMNLADELGRKARTKEARELLKAVYDNIFYSEVI